MSLQIDDDVRILHSDNRNEWGEPDWSILDDRRGILPEFPQQIFTEDLQGYLERAAAGAGVTVAHVAVPLISIASGLIGCSRMVQASKGWREPIVVWTSQVGLSGSGKTPGYRATTKPLASIEKDRRSRIAELERKHQTRTEAAKAAHKKWLAEVSEATEAGTSPPLMPANAAKVPPFVAPRLFVTDATIERIGQLVQARPSGLAIIVDELAGLFANMGRYSNGDDRAFWLAAWNGDPHLVERVNGSPISLDHLLVCLTGGFQPDKLARAFDGDDDGFYARFCFAWPSEPEYRPLTNDVDIIEPAIVNALSRLIQLSEPADDDVFVPRSLPLSADASEAFEQFRKKWHDDKQALEGREREWWSKGPSQVLRLAGTIALLEWAWSGEHADLVEVGAPSLNAATELWSEFFWPHSRACLRQGGSSKSQTLARRVLRWLQRHEKHVIGIEDARRDALGQTLNASDTQTLLETMEKRNWLRKVKTKTGGRPLHRWEVNPILHMNIGGGVC